MELNPAAKSIARQLRLSDDEFLSAHRKRGDKPATDDDDAGSGDSMDAAETLAEEGIQHLSDYSLSGEDSDPSERFGHLQKAFKACGDAVAAHLDKHSPSVASTHTVRFAR